MSRRTDTSKQQKNQIIKTTKKEEVKEIEVSVPTSNYDRVQEMKDVFKMFDKDGNGRVSASEVGALLSSLGRQSSEEDVQKLIEETDKNGNGEIDLDEFLTFMESTYVMKKEAVEDIVAAFKIFDLDNNGWISCEEFKNILMKFGGDFTEDEVEHIFRESDVNNDGKLAYAEFVDLWRFQ